MSHSSPTYLMVGLTGVVKMDLAGTIGAAVPDARILAVKTFEEAIDAAREMASLAGVVVRAGVRELQSSELAEILNALSPRVVLVGDDAEEDGEISPYPVLRRPFSIDDVLGALSLKR